MRLDRYLANAGVGTRKEVKQLIKKSFVTVNGEIVKVDSTDINEYSDKICVNDEEIIYHQFHYILLNKPQGYVSACDDNRYPPVTDLVPEYAFANLFPVGRLDLDTTGTLLLTNNGSLCHKMLSPKYHVDKTYLVTTDYPIKEELIQKFEHGVEMEGELTLPAKLEIVDTYKGLLTIHQGKYHQVKRMFGMFGYTVIALDRVSFGFLNHEGLKQGEYRELTEEEIAKLQEYEQAKKI